MHDGARIARVVFVWVVWAAAWIGARGVAAEVDYPADIKPILKSRCYACHGPLKQEAGLRLDTVAAMRKGSESGSVVEADGAILLARITAGEGERMPPEGAALGAEEIGRIGAWIAGGAAGPANEQPELDPRQHWAYQKPRRAEGADLDALLDARLGAMGYKRQAEAAPEVWLRRVYFDLIGLPPTPAEIREFQESCGRNAQLAKAQTVDRLLASSAYGERWARHFMDIWRYSDWYGLGAELRNSQKHIWHWRDWIVESLNADKPYDRMIVEMLAADEAFPTDRDALRATGFLARNYYIFNRDTWLDDVVEHTSRALIGVTMQCVKCHDHKYDPIEQVDYYRMRAIFEPYHLRLDAWPGESDFEKDGLPRAFDLHVEQPTYLFVRGNDKQPDRSKAIAPGVPAVLGGDFVVQAVDLPAEAYAPGIREENLRTLEMAAERQVGRARMALAQAAPEEQAVALKKLAAAEAEQRRLRACAAADVARFVKQTPSEELDRAAAKAEREAELQQAEAAALAAERTLAKRKADEAGKPATIKQAEEAVAAAHKEAARVRAALESNDASYRNIEGSRVALVKWVAGDPAKEKAERELGEVFPRTSTGRRLALARWIASADHPLTARVVVNHVWLRHFGASLVTDVSDFGLRCPPPLFQDVLDTLAVDFMAQGWSLKRLHRQLVLSRLYGTSSSNANADGITLAADADNAYYWRMNPRRLESQAVRDALLLVGGKLDLTIGGASIDPKDETSTRRSLYFVQTTEIEDRLLNAFDNASVLECYRRQESIAPQQALALANGKLTQQCAEALAGRLAKLDERAFLDEAFLAILGRKASAAEQAACAETMVKLAGAAGEGAKVHRARTLLLQALMSHNDFVVVR